MVWHRRNLLLLFGTMLLAGCGDPYARSDADLEAMAGEPLKETVPVSGTVTLDGAVAVGLEIYAYTREGGTDAADQCDVKNDGTFCFTTYRGCDGMLPGSYRLAFAQYDPEVKWDEREDLLEGRYWNPMEHEFELVVESGQPQSGLMFELTSGE